MEVVFGCICFFLLSCAFYMRTTKNTIKELMTNMKLYPKHYAMPPRFIRNIFSLKKRMLPRFICFRLYQTLAWPIVGIICIVLLSFASSLPNFDACNKVVFMVLFSYFLIDTTVFVIFYIFFEKYKGKRKKTK